MNANFEIMNDFHAKIDEFRPDIVVVSGFQLMNSSDRKEEILRKMNAIF